MYINSIQTTLFNFGFVVFRKALPFQNFCGRKSSETPKNSSETVNIDVFDAKHMVSACLQTV